MTMVVHSLFYVWRNDHEAKDTLYLLGISIGSVSMGYLVLEPAQRKLSPYLTELFLHLVSAGVLALPNQEM